jgi:hypothetical protein
MKDKPRPDSDTELFVAKHALGELASRWRLAPPSHRQRVEAEVADVALYMIRLASQCGVDLASAATRRLSREAEPAVMIAAPVCGSTLH